MKWNENVPADKMPLFMKKDYFLLLSLAIAIPAIFFVILENVSVIRFLIFVFIFILISWTSISIILLQTERRLVKYVQFLKNEILWKTKTGKTGKIYYGGVNTICRTKKPSLKTMKTVPTDEEMYTVLYEHDKNFWDTPVPSRFKDAFVAPPGGLVLNKENTRILIQKLKEIDPDLKNVEIVGWNENAK